MFWRCVYLHKWFLLHGLYKLATDFLPELAWQQSAFLVILWVSKHIFHVLEGKKKLNYCCTALSFNLSDCPWIVQINLWIQVDLVEHLNEWIKTVSKQRSDWCLHPLWLTYRNIAGRFRFGSWLMNISVKPRMLLIMGQKNEDHKTPD